MQDMQVNESGWFKSSYSGQNGDCVEIRLRTDDGIDLRDTKNRQGPVVIVGALGWSAFTAAVRNGGLEH
jgi:hypothetical protein